MPWVGTCMEELRLNFIETVASQQIAFRDICDAFGISRKTGYKWLNRFEAEGKAGLKDKSRRPLARPRNTPNDIETAIVAEKLRHPYWGPKKLLTLLKRAHPDRDWPSLTTAANILRRNGCTAKRYKRARLAAAAALENCTAPNHVWSADFKGWWKLLDGSICQPFTLLDTYSRFIFSCRHIKGTGLQDVKPLLEELFQEFGMPQRFRTDNGPPFASTSIARLSRLSIWLIKLGIVPEWITPGKPQENGIHERMHRTLKMEAAQPLAEDLTSQEIRLDQFQHQYNYVRPHEAHSLDTPASIYVPSERKWTGELSEPVYTDEYKSRAVDKRGKVSWKGTHFFTSELLQGESVGIRERGEINEVYYGPILLGRIDSICGFKKV